MDEGIKVPDTKPDSPQVKEVKDDVQKYGDLTVLVESNGGKILIGTIKQSIADDVEIVCSLLKDNEVELRCAVASLKAHVDLLRVLQNAPVNAKMATTELSKLLEVEKQED